MKSSCLRAAFSLCQTERKRAVGHPKDWNKPCLCPNATKPVVTGRQLDFKPERPSCGTERLKCSPNAQKPPVTFDLLTQLRKLMQKEETEINITSWSG